MEILMPTQKKAIHNVISYLLYYGTVLVFGLVLPRLYIKNFGSATNGLDATLRQIFSCLSLLEAGVGLASQQAYYKPVAEDRRNEINAILSATCRYYKKTGLVYGLVTLCLCVIYPLCVNSELSYATVFLIIFIYGVPGVASYLVQGKYRSFLEASGETYVVTYITTGSTIIGNFARIAALLWSGNILVVQATYLIPTALQLACILWYVKKHYPWMNFHVKPDTAALGQKNAVILHQISETIFNNTDTILISSICSLSAASVYSVHSIFFSNLQKIFDSVVISISFKLGQLFNTDKKAFCGAFEIYVSLVYTAVFACFTATALFIVPIIEMYTSGITDAVYIRPDVAVLFTAVVILSCIKRPWTNVITYSGAFRNTKHQAIIETVINVGASIPAAYMLGISGALIGTFCALTYRVIATILYVYREIFHKSPLKDFVILAVNSVASVIVIKTVGLFTCSGKNIVIVLATACLYGVISVAVFGAINAALNPSVAKRLMAYARR